MPSKTVSFKTFGCKQNQYDTDFLKESFQGRGFAVVDDGPADIVVVNTCAVTAKGASKCRQAIRSAVREGAKVVVTGCYPQVALSEIADIPGVIAISGVRGRAELAGLVEKALLTGEKIVAVKPHVGQRSGAAASAPSRADSGESSGGGAAAIEEFEETPVSAPSLTRAFLKIQEGCGDFCSYCIVPYARGPSRSRPAERVLAEAAGLVAKGYKEIVLTGTHIGLYGQGVDACPLSGDPADPQGDRDTPQPLPDIIRLVAGIPGLIRLRVSSLEPHDVTDDLLDCLRLPQVCHHLHLPLQSGSDRVLCAMGRRYDVAGFLDVVRRARRVAPDIGVTADVIAGFPGETPEDFDETLRVAREARFSRIHAFKFSARPGTKAYGLPDKVSERQKEERISTLIAAGRELSLDFHRKHVGRSMEVLVEDDRTGDGLLTGVTRNYIRCFFQGADGLKGKVVPVSVRTASASSVQCDVEAGPEAGPE